MSSGFVKRNPTTSENLMSDARSPGKLKFRIRLGYHVNKKRGSQNASCDRIQLLFWLCNLSLYTGPDG